MKQSIFIDMFGDARSEKIGPLLEFVTSGGRGWAKYYTDAGDLFLRSLDVRMNSIVVDSAAYVDPPDNAEARRTRTQAGDVLLTITGSRIGRAAVVDETLDGSYISQHVAILRPMSAVMESEFLSAFLCLPSGGQKQIARAQYGQTKPGLNFEQIRSFKVPSVPPQRQREFVGRTLRTKLLESQHRTALTELDALFASLQSRAFRGEL